jgi:N-acetyl-gamma-glutamyl-phosphate reductase
MSEKISVALIGASGYGGAELARLLANHRFAELKIATASGERAGAKLSDLFPSLRGVCDLVCEELNLDKIAQCDFVFIALGHGKAMAIAPQLLERGLKVCDFGGDFRLRDASIYEKWYKTPHTARELLSQAVYGLPEWNRDKIKDAKLVANPGCYPTSAILALAPLVEANVIDDKSIIVDSASGTSGAGRSSFGLGLHHSEVSEDFKAYKIAAHQHTPEIEQALGDACGHEIILTFTAHLLPIARGILTTSYATVRGAQTTESLHQILASRYKNEPFVRVWPAGETPQLKHTVGSNFCDIGVQVDKRTNRAIIVSAEDNLIKGAAGQALQNMNIMCGFDESEGLRSAALFP